MLILIEADPLGDIVDLHIFADQAMLLTFVDKRRSLPDHPNPRRLTVYEQVAFIQPAIGSWTFSFTKANLVPLDEWVQRQQSDKASSE